MGNIDKYKSDLQYILSMLKYKEEEKSLKQYISDNNDKIQNMNQDSHNVAVALLNQNLPKLIDNQKGDFRMGKNALQAIYDRGVNQGEVLHLIMQINKKILNNKNLDTIANELEEKKRIFFLSILSSKNIQINPRNKYMQFLKKSPNTKSR